METQIVDLNNGTQVLGGGTASAGGSTTETGLNFTGGLLQIREKVAGWEISGKLGTLSGEADIYIAEKDGQKGVVKYYRSVTSPKTEILEKIKGLKHPNIVNVYDFGIYNNRFYEIMEYAAGGSLDSRNEDGSCRYLPLTEEDTVEVCKEVLNSYKACHEAGIIHRDIKPANIYYRRFDEENRRGTEVVIADFGISSIMDETEELHKTRTGSRTTGYAAPEVLSGIISPKMDYYALGITLWELLTGRDPFTLDNGKRRNDAHLIRDTIEGRIADDILSREPRVSARMERLIRGLLVIDPDHRWGYGEVTRYLAGEDVEVYRKQRKQLNFTVGDVVCTTLEELGSALMDNPEVAKKYLFRGLLAAFLEDEYPDTAKQLTEITEASSAAGDHYGGIVKAAYLLNPGMPLKLGRGFTVQNIDDVRAVLENAPETVVPLLRDETSKLYTYLEIIGYGDAAAEIKKLPREKMSAAALAGKAAVILMGRIIKPFKLSKYADFELSTLEQLRKVPRDMQDHILTLVKEKSYDGLFLPWFEILTQDNSISAIETDSWDRFIETAGCA
jgi:tRNA A-37 threonylcarbamoyl transferase component Bud32